MEDQLDSIINYLREKGIDATVKDSNTIVFHVEISGVNYDAYCALGKGFPYVLPEINASDSLFEKIKNIPHVSYWKNICTFDKTTTIANFNSPENIIYACIKKAMQTINDGLNNENENDYVDEMKSYWGNVPSAKTFYYLPNEKGCENEFWCSDDLLLTTKDNHSKGLQKCLVINASFIFKGDYNFKNFVYQCLDSNSRKKLFDFIGYDISNPKMVLIKNIINEKTILLGLFTPSYQGTINGFRNGKINIFTAINFFKDKTFHPFNVMNVTQDYLYKRGGTGVIKGINNVCIVGCGSFGSYLSEMLMDYGINNFLLVDNETLSSDNIARHLCGFNYREMPKAEAVGHFLITHNPNVLYKHMNKDIHQVLNDNCEELNNYDYIFICLGDIGTEKRFCDLVKDSKITKPVVIIWAEPYCLACHAIILNNNLEVFSLLYNSKMEFIHSVVDNSTLFYKRESGCQSTYIPYSSYMIKSFLLDLLRNLFVQKTLVTNNYSFTWLGDLNNLCEVKAVLKDEYAHHSSFSHIIRKIS